MKAPIMWDNRYQWSFDDLKVLVYNGTYPSLWQLYQALQATHQYLWIQPGSHPLPNPQ